MLLRCCSVLCRMQHARTRKCATAAVQSNKCSGARRAFAVARTNVEQQLHNVADLLYRAVQRASTEPSEMGVGKGPLPDVPSGRRRRTGRRTRPAGRRDLPPDGARRRPGPGRSRRRTAGRGRAGPDIVRRTAPDGATDAADGPDGARRGVPDGSRRVPDRAPDGAGRGPPAPDARRSPTRSPTGPTGSPTPWTGRGQIRPPRRPTGGARCCRWSQS